jgi:cell wall assembly regulator SMI1
MHSLWEQLIDVEEASGSPIRRFLRPGIPEESVRDRLEAIGLTAPAELVELYVWHDGTDQGAWLGDGHQNNLCLLPFARFTPLAESISDYLELKSNWQKTPWYEDYLAGNDPGWGYWRTEWFPVFQSDKWRHAVDCLRTDTNPVWHVYFEPFPKTEPSHASLSDLAEILTGLFRSGRCTWSSDRQQVIDTLDYGF